MSGSSYIGAHIKPHADSICVNSTFFSLILIGLWGPGKDRDRHVSTQGGERTGRGAHREGGRVCNFIAL